MTYRNRRLLDAVRELPCQLQVVGVCQGGPCVPCHLNMQAFDKGLGHKAMDVPAAGCAPCHHEVDDGKTLSREDRQFYLMRGALRTVHLLLMNGWRFQHEQQMKPARQE